jgi:hypothetical protein
MVGSRRALIAFGFWSWLPVARHSAGMVILKPLWDEHVGVFHDADGTIMPG